MWSMFVFFAWILFFWMLFDRVRRPLQPSTTSAAGRRRAGPLFVIILPFLGIFVYLIAEG